MSRLRLILVDDHEVVRIGLRTLLARHPDFEVVDEAATGQEAVRKALMHRPDIVIMDVRLSGMSGIEACREITQAAPNIKVIMLTSYGDDDTLFESIAAGASGYVLKQIGSDELIRSIENVGRGEASLDPTTTSRVFARMREIARKREESAFALLTEQELRVLAHLAEGRTNREIADLLVLGEGTVRNYVSSIFAKLHVNNRAEAAAYAAAHNIRDYL
ncbi:MAG: DNA-binding response regulator [Candidatus Roseilinea sp.]|jgi:DNA-binding NarL/FixJ family response regulator|uniref:DNA-binding response regulator n=1 Tax=Candidatus Thermofonsia Clade 3 bacterium TaxID=2364212 RepID=A0A2M8QBJ7_9CHLR|nr:response regulator transcription factor [Candidatus Roseilinea sp. NK_OTU-006]PJF47178.1 MAG: DNA-binding response regulator [Candidatus Thermofonsia Clade 3 bacterium]RMG64693.1 MAG: DNA-binding response regulator [Chloroflexota bacterium]GIV84363.1 MAG: DNA-binding response regulator [Candidatus Roseilinea sp.]